MPTVIEPFAPSDEVAMFLKSERLNSAAKVGVLAELDAKFPLYAHEKGD